MLKATTICSTQWVHNVRLRSVFLKQCGNRPVGTKSDAVSYHYTWFMHPCHKSMNLCAKLANETGGARRIPNEQTIVLRVWYTIHCGVESMTVSIYCVQSAMDVNLFDCCEAVEVKSSFVVPGPSQTQGRVVRRLQL